MSTSRAQSVLTAVDPMWDRISLWLEFLGFPDVVLCFQIALIRRRTSVNWPRHSIGIFVRGTVIRAFIWFRLWYGLCGARLCGPGLLGRAAELHRSCSLGFTFEIGVL